MNDAVTYYFSIVLTKLVLVLCSVYSCSIPFFASSLSSYNIIIHPRTKSYNNNRRCRRLCNDDDASPPSLLLLRAAKKNRPNSRDDDNDLSSWYDPVDEDATPDTIFFQEMERQRLINQVGGGDRDTATTPTATNGNGYNYDYDPIASIGMSSRAAISGASSSSSKAAAKGGGVSRFANSQLPMSGFPERPMSPPSSLFGGGSRNTVVGVDTRGGNAPPPYQRRRRVVPTMDQIKIAETTLSEYELFAVSDNWLDEGLQKRMWEEEKNKTTSSSSSDNFSPPPSDDDDPTVIMTDLLLNKNDDNKDADDEQEPWDYFGKESLRHVDADRRNVLEVPFPPKDSEFYFDFESPIDPNEIEHSENALAYRMRNVQTKSKRLEKARRSLQAKEFFQRGPNKKEGYDVLWVAAVDNVSYQPLIGNLRDYGVEFADNFGDFVDSSSLDALTTIEDKAAWKARQVYEVTGLPTISSQTSFEIEPVPLSSLYNLKDSVTTSSTNQAAAASRLSDPKVVSGYKINDISNHVDYLSDALRPMSEPERVTRFTSCMCFYDGKMEIFEYGVLDCALHFCNSMRTFIPLAQATNAMIETVKFTFGLEYQKFLKIRTDDALFGDSNNLPGPVSSAGAKLRDRVLKDGKVLPNDIIDVSKFMDSQVDADLMDLCAQELSERFVNTRPTKIMTVATTGLVVALPMARYLQVPVVYARKERNVVMGDAYSAAYTSKTVGKNRQLLVSKKHVDQHDRVLIVDDFLSSGSSQEALLRILSDAGATPVGIGVLLEKAYDPGRKSLSGYDIPIQSLCRVASVEGSVIQLVEEEGYDKIME